MPMQILLLGGGGWPVLMKMLLQGGGGGGGGGGRGGSSSCHTNLSLNSVLSVPQAFSSLPTVTGFYRGPPQSGQPPTGLTK